MDPPPPYIPRAAPAPLQRDPETASIRSAAPSYVSEAPTYVSTIPTSSSSSPRPGLPSPYQTPPSSLPALNIPSLVHFRTPGPALSPVASGPKSRHYYSVASRRASQATASSQASLLLAAINGEEGLSALQQKIATENRDRSIRTAEDPELVGEVAAEENRKEREARERGYEVLESEDKRWDWALDQMKDWEERDRSWRKFREEVQMGKRAKLARRLGVESGR